MKVRENPTYTIHGVHELARRLWVANIMRNPAQGIMGVQTLRNWIMGSTLMASTAAILIIGTLTLSGQAESITRSWHVLSMTSSHAAELWIVKVMALLITFIVAFFAFAMSVRLANHVVFMINVPEFEAHHNLSPESVARRLHRSGTMFSIGMRAFLFAIPLVFWLFGPYFLVAASIGLIIALYRLDRSESEGVMDVGPSKKQKQQNAPVVSIQAKYAK
ncbi:DUF599 domain-containing protein [Thiobacillus sp.]|uniref:DUF599 domain-containing protein n=1 Tax=Thiobacillus sp. TaxID=924 RepID=UPI0025DBAD99|nr:DUF599 domain-containing protein [Thiobacillus sp.]